MQIDESTVLRPVPSRRAGSGAQRGAQSPTTAAEPLSPPLSCNSLSLSAAMSHHGLSRSLDATRWLIAGRQQRSKQSPCVGTVLMVPGPGAGIMVLEPRS